MSRVAYVNGAYLPLANAAVHIEDRGYQFADGIYEVIAVSGGKLTDWQLHLQRLERSLKELQIAKPMGDGPLHVVAREVLRRNRIRDGMLYIQITRGVARRDHPFPGATRPSIVMTARAVNFTAVAKRAEKGVAVMSLPDIRWGRCDIKTVSLLPNVLAKQQAREAGVFEAWMVDKDGYVTEGTSTNAWIVDADGRLITRPTSDNILSGITRTVLLDLAGKLGIEVVQRAFTIDEAKAAREAFFSSTTAFLMPVTEIDGTVIGNGHPGSVSRKLRDAYVEHLKTA